jgi:hypothetical protein
MAAYAAIRIGGGVPSFEVCLVRPHAVELRQESRINVHLVHWAGDVDLGHPALYSVGIELFIKRRV